MGTLEEIHEATTSRCRLEEAYVKIKAGLGTVNRVLECVANGDRFKVKVDELCCMPMANVHGSCIRIQT